MVADEPRQVQLHDDPRVGEVVVVGGVGVLEGHAEVELRQCDVGVDGAAALEPGEAELFRGVAKALVLDLAALLVHREEVKIHRTGHVIVDSENIENCFNLFDIIINTSLVFLINFCRICRYFKINKYEIFMEEFLN